MIIAESFIASTSSLGFSLFTGVPCSYLTPLINGVINSNEVDYINAVNEGDAIAIAAGEYLGGGKAVVMMQNSGLGNAVNPLTSLCLTYSIPVLLIISLRGDPAIKPDAPQHQLMGKITTDLLELMSIQWEFLPAKDDELLNVLRNADQYMQEKQRPYALVVKKEAISPVKLVNKIMSKRPQVLKHYRTQELLTPRLSRIETLKIIHQYTSDKDVILTTTGYTGRELFSYSDRKNQFYMAGSMGCVSSLGLGLSHASPNHRIIVVDGDGAALMRLGALAAIGAYCPNNLIHILLDNGVHESTGGQSTVSKVVDFCAVARSCGYPNVHYIRHEKQLSHAFFMSLVGMHFIYIPIKPGHSSDLTRPSLLPRQMVDRIKLLLHSEKDHILNENTLA